MLSYRHLYRIAQEQCTNIIKYSKATKVYILLALDDAAFKMIIADNGIGADTTVKAKGIGLKNINDRISIFNGESKIISRPGNGFTIEISIPL